MESFTDPKSLAAHIRHCGEDDGWGFQCDTKIILNGVETRLHINLPKTNLTWATRRIFELVAAFTFQHRDYRVVPTWIECTKTCIEIEGNVNLGKSGKSVATWSRYAYYTDRGQPKSIYHASFDIHNALHRGQGLAKAWINECFDRYRNLGFKAVKVEAGGANGNYTWATMGFELDPDYDRPVLPYNKQAEMRAVVERAAKRGTNQRDIEIARQIIEDKLPEKMAISEVANLGKDGPWRDRRRNHLGKVMLLNTSRWFGIYPLTGKGAKRQAQSAA